MDEASLELTLTIPTSVMRRQIPSGVEDSVGETTGSGRIHSGMMMSYSQFQASRLKLNSEMKGIIGELEKATKCHTMAVDCLTSVYRRIGTLVDDEKIYGEADESAANQGQYSRQLRANNILLRETLQRRYITGHTPLVDVRRTAMVRNNMPLAHGSANHSLPGGFNILKGALYDTCRARTKGPCSFMGYVPGPGGEKLQHDQYCIGNRYPRSNMKDATNSGVWIKKLATQEQLERVWFEHIGPPMIELTGDRFKAALRRGALLEHPLISAVLCNFREREFDLSMRDCSNCRHYVATEWAMIALSGDPGYQSLAWFNQTPSKIKINDCTIVIAMVYLSHTWSCYAFDFQKKMLTVMDPRISTPEEMQLIQLHNCHSVKLLDQAIYCMQQAACDLTLGCGEWRKNLLTGGGKACKPFNTSVYSLNFARWFNGTTVCDPVGKDNKVAQCKMEMFYQALGMKENKGLRPLMDIQRARAETTYSVNDDSD